MEIARAWEETGVKIPAPYARTIKMLFAPDKGDVSELSFSFALIDPGGCEFLKDKGNNLGDLGRTTHVIEEDNDIPLAPRKIPDRFTTDRIGEGLSEPFGAELWGGMPVHVVDRQFPVVRKAEFGFNIAPPGKLRNHDTMV